MKNPTRNDHTDDNIDTKKAAVADQAREATSPVIVPTCSSVSRAPCHPMLYTPPYVYAARMGPFMFATGTR